MKATVGPALGTPVPSSIEQKQRGFAQEPIEGRDWPDL
jgi:hypothetical protein